MWGSRSSRGSTAIGCANSTWWDMTLRTCSCGQWFRGGLGVKLEVFQGAVGLSRAILSRRTDCGQSWGSHHEVSEGGGKWELIIGTGYTSYIYHSLRKWILG